MARVARVEEFNPIKLNLFEDGIGLSMRFLRHNQLEPIKSYQLRDIKSTGEYKPRLRAVFVNLPHTALPVQNPGNQRWSYPGYKVDRTAFGVVAHETGHHVDHILGACRRSAKKRWVEVIVSSKKTVSSYEPSPHEAFAETMKLFITNPHLLCLGIPTRYSYLTDTLKLKPLIQEEWQRLLPREYHAAAQAWIDRK